MPGGVMNDISGEADIAKKMLLKGMDDDSIMELTGLTHEQLHQLKS